MALSRCFAQCVAQSRYFAQFMALSDAIASVTINLRTQFCDGLDSAINFAMAPLSIHTGMDYTILWHYQDTSQVRKCGTLLGP